VKNSARKPAELTNDYDVSQPGSSASSGSQPGWLTQLLLKPMPLFIPLSNRRGEAGYWPVKASSDWPVAMAS